jgi:hypothetical protein
VLVCSERKVLLAGCWWLVCSERKILLTDKPSEQGVRKLLYIYVILFNVIISCVLALGDLVRFIVSVATTLAFMRCEEIGSYYFVLHVLDAYVIFFIRL